MDLKKKVNDIMTSFGSFMIKGNTEKVSHNAYEKM